MTVEVFIAWLVCSNLALFCWYRRAKRKRRAELMLRRLMEAERQHYILSPRDVVSITELTTIEKPRSSAQQAS